MRTRHYLAGFGSLLASTTLAAFFLAVPDAALSDACSAEVKVEWMGEEEEVISANEYGCKRHLDAASTDKPTLDVTDVPVSAVRLNNQQVIMTAGNTHSFFFIGANLNDVGRNTLNACGQECPSLLKPNLKQDNPALHRQKTYILGLKWMPNENNQLAIGAGTYSGTTGNNLISLIHSEYHGEKAHVSGNVLTNHACHPDNWPTTATDRRMRYCWYTSTLFARHTFDAAGLPTVSVFPQATTTLNGVQQTHPRFVIGAPPVTYAHNELRRGVGMPKGIWGYHESNASPAYARRFYVFGAAGDIAGSAASINAEDPNDNLGLPVPSGARATAVQSIGQCLYQKGAKTAQTWKAWNGDRTTPLFNKDHASAYTSADGTTYPETPRSRDANGNPEHCNQVVPGNMTSVRWVESKNMYLATFDRRDPTSDLTIETLRQITYRWSSNLIDWGPEHVLLPNPVSNPPSTNPTLNMPKVWTMKTAPARCESSRLYHSILDPDSPDVNFDTIKDDRGANNVNVDDTLYIYWVRLHSSGDLGHVVDTNEESFEAAPRGQTKRCTFANHRRSIVRAKIKIHDASGTAP